MNSYGQNFKGSGNKGKGKGGKGDTSLAVSRRRAAHQQGGAKPLCREYQRTGKCTWQERTGRQCNFAHGDKLPAALSGVCGLTTADLPGNVQYSLHEGLLHCTCGGEVSATAVVSLEAEVAQISAQVEKERAEDWTISGPTVSPGFQWPAA